MGFLMTRFVPPPHPQAAELAEYSSKIALLEEAKRVKEEEAESWHSKVSFQHAIKGRTDSLKSQGLPGKCQNKPFPTCHLFSGLFFMITSLFFYVTCTICNFPLHVCILSLTLVQKKVTLYFIHHLSGVFSRPEQVLVQVAYKYLTNGLKHTIM